MGFFSKLLPAAKISEAEEKKIAEGGSEKQRLALALNPRASQEILYYLALHDQSEKVRKAVAGNPSTPLQASSLLAKDKSRDVRFIMAHRLVKILPELTEERYTQLYAFAVQSLGMLALDEVLKIRKALSQTLKDYAFIPSDLAAQLARDLEREVSEPILRFCMALGDDDLCDILATHPENWAAEAIAGRETVSARVSAAVIDTGNAVAGAILLNNKGAIITEELLETIVARASEYPEWHKPIAVHKALSPLMAQKLAAYVDKTVRKILLERSDLDKRTIEDVASVIRRRMEYEEERKNNFAGADPVKRAKKMFADGILLENVFEDAIAMHDRKFVMAALALRADTSIANIEKVFDVKAPKAICAVCWKAGLSMRMAMRLQQTFGAVKPSALIYPRHGTDYPLTEEEMRWQLGVAGI